MVKKGLGRGLNALFSDNDNTVKDNISELNTKKNVSRETLDKISDNTNTNIDINVSRETVDNVIEIDISKIVADKEQPRKYFNEDTLLELCNSIRVHGIINPIIVVKNNDNLTYNIVAGERRYRAALRVGLTSIPVIIKNYTKKEINEIGLIDNLQRDDLNPIDTAKAIKKLMQDFNYTQEQVADRIGKSRSVVTNTLRLLNLSSSVIQMIVDNELSSGHARTLVVVENKAKQLDIANMCIKKNLSVRELEKVVKDYLHPMDKKIIPVNQSIELVDLTNKMKRYFGTKVSIMGNDDKGKIVIEYFNKDDLDRFSDLIK